jgi:hypothetical protein
MNRTATRLFRPILRTALSAGVCGALIAGGCRKSEPPPPPTLSLPTAADYNARSSDVMQRVVEFQVLATQLEVLNPSAHTPVLRQVFVSLSDILPKLAGSQPGGVFVHQFLVVSQVRDQVVSRRSDLPIEPGLVDAGLLAAYNAVRDLGQTEFYRDDALTQQLDDLAKKVAATQSARGIEHDLTVRDTVGAMSKVLLKLAGTLKEKVATTAEIPPASAPAATVPATTAPSAPATTAPSSPAMPPEPAPAAPSTPPAPSTPATPPEPATPPATVPTSPAPTTPDTSPPAAPSPTTPPQATPPPDSAVPAPPAPPPGAPAPTDPSKPPETPPAPPAPGEGNK